MINSFHTCATSDQVARGPLRAYHTTLKVRRGQGARLRHAMQRALLNSVTALQVDLCSGHPDRVCLMTHTSLYLICFLHADSIFSVMMVRHTFGFRHPTHARTAHSPCVNHAGTRPTRPTAEMLDLVAYTPCGVPCKDPARFLLRLRHERLHCNSARVFPEHASFP